MTTMMMAAEAQLIGGAAVSSRGLSMSSSRNYSRNLASSSFKYSFSYPTCSTGGRGLRRRNNNNIINDAHGDGGVCSLLPLDRRRGAKRAFFLPCDHPPLISTRKQLLLFPRLNTHLSSSDCGMQSSDVEEEEAEETTALQEQCHTSSKAGGFDELNGMVSSQINETNDKLTETPTRSIFQSKNVRGELIMLSLPALGGQAIEPMVQLMETAYIGHFGSVELASAGVSISLFNIISKLFNIPLLSVATSFVAEDISKNASGYSTSEKLLLSSVSTALLLAVGIGIFEAVALVLGSGPLLSLMGITTTSSMRHPAQQFLILRALGAPAFVVSLAVQGIFRGFKDTKTPVFCLGFGNFTAIFLFPLLMHYYQLGVYGAAIATVASQYVVTFSLIWHLNKRVVILPPKLGQLQFGGYLKSGGFLIGRTLAVLLTMTLGTSMAARQGPVAMAAHQICLQVWLAVSLLTDALAASAQALIASYISKDDYRTVRDITHFVLKVGFVTGVSLAVVLGVSFSSLAPLFTKDIQVLDVVRTGVLFVSASQPINALAFILDGLHYGVSDFGYAAVSMMVIGAISSAYMVYAPRVFGLPGVWSGLTLFMGLRMVAGFIRLLEPKGPWWFLHVKEI